MSLTQKAALNYARHGIPVFPCKPDKSPYTKHGFKDATADESRIRAWWSEWPDALIGMPTGVASGVVVVDCDMKKGKSGYDTLFELKRAYGALPETRKVRTPSDGWHYYFKHPGGEIKTGVDLLGEGLDVRGDGGYVIVPPSPGYEFIDKELPGDMPEWMRARLRKDKPRRPNGGGVRHTPEAGKVQSALSVLDPDMNYDKWVEVGMAIHSEGLSVDLWDAWSARGSKYRPGECEKKWAGFNGNGGISVGTLYSMADTTGRHWRLADTKSAKSNGSGTDTAARGPGEDELALSFSEKYAGELCHVGEWGQWLKWEGRYWKRDKTTGVFDLVRTHCRQMFALAAEDGKRPKRPTKNQVAAVEKFASADRRQAITGDVWDTDQWVINTQTCIVDLRNGNMHYHHPGHYMTKITAVVPALPPSSEKSLWQKFLEDITNHDHALIGYLQRFCGYALTGSTREHVFPFLYGTGANGKGTFINTITGVMGDYAGNAPMETFTETHGERHPTELAMLRGKRLVVAQETEQGRRWAESRIKTLTGGDAVTARFMRQDFFEYVPQFKLAIAGNHKPQLRNVDEAMKRRLHLVPFDVTIPPEKRDPDLTEKLKREWCWILGWMVQGAVAYYRDGLNPPERVLAATAEYFAGQDAFGQWLEDWCEVGPGHWDLPKRLHNSWKEYAEEIGEKVGTKREFSEKMEARGFTSRTATRSRGGNRSWDGLKLKPRIPEEDS